MRMSSFAIAHRDSECERRPHPHLALDPDPTSVQLDKLPTEGQPQPSAFHLLVCHSHLPELLEHGLLILWGDADARIADRDLDGSILERCSDLNASTLGRELDRVRQ